MKNKKWLRFRFYSDAEDIRPIYKLPNTPEGPWWCSGYSGDRAILIAYVKSEDTLFRQWPEAEIDEVAERDEIIFTDRFPKPDWWDDNPTQQRK